MWRGPRTAVAGLVGNIWAVTIQSNSASVPRGKASLSAPPPLQFLDVGSDVNALDRRELLDALGREPVEKLDGRARIGGARVRVAIFAAKNSRKR